MSTHKPQSKGKKPASRAQPAMVQPPYSRLMAFPVEVMLPLRLIWLNDGLRRLRIERPGQPLPAPIVAWLRSDPRYTQWLDDTESG